MKIVIHLSFETELTFPSAKFQKLIRDMTNIGELIDIKSVGNNLMLNCEGAALQETVLSETQDGLNFNLSSKPETPIQGTFSYFEIFIILRNVQTCVI